MTLADFLLARLGEDEAAARAAQGKAWTMLRYEGLGDRTADEDVNAYARRFTPARIIADCETKREIVEGLEALVDDYRRDSFEIEYAMVVVYPALALPYADHPDYQEEWKP